MNKKQIKRFTEKILLIRKFENLLLTLFRSGYIKGTTHTCNGQEATPVICLNKTEKEDCVVSNHRSHGHFLSYSNLAEELLLELLGRDDGICKGIAGSQHIHYRNFFSNGILGNLVPMGVGLALSKKITGEKGTVYIFLGDGTFGQGVVYESLNIASIKKLKCMFVVENNRIAQTTPIENHLAGDISKRFESFGIKTFKTNSFDVLSLNNTFEKAKKFIKNNKRPCSIIVETYRFNAHSKGDDTRKKSYIEKIRKQKDPIDFLKKKLSNETFNKIQKNISSRLNLICEKHNLKI